VRRSYNPTTGEELNIVEENMVDRPWYEREYMRVDWSQNLVDNPDWSFLFYGRSSATSRFSRCATTSRTRAPNAPNFCEMRPGTVRNETTGECEQNANARNHPGGYFDVTSRGWSPRR
jgi:hypothetical protein